MLLNIEKLIYGGDGLARLPADEHGRGKAAFVPFVVEGETIEASIIEESRGFVRARADRIVDHSAERVEPPCPYFYRCGGCQYQHITYEHQVESKAAILRETLARMAKLEIPEIDLVRSPAWKYRNRTRLKVRARPEFALGYYRLNSHELLPVEICPISSPLINEALKQLWAAGRTGAFPQGIEEIELFADHEDKQLLVECYCGEKVSRENAFKAAETLREVVPQAVGVVIFATDGRDGQGEELGHVGSESLTYAVQDQKYRVSAGAFFQVNRFLINELVRIVVDSAAGERALDLYAGVGLFSVALAQSFAQVTAVESSQSSFRDLQYNRPPNVKAVQVTTQRFLDGGAGRHRYDVVVVDPPRGGLGEQVVQRLLELGAPMFVYVSCDPATLARDLRGLCGGGYRVRRAQMVDLFPETFHLESVIHLTRQAA